MILVALLGLFGGCLTCAYQAVRGLQIDEHEPSWADVRSALHDWPVDLLELGRPSYVQYITGLKGNFLSVEIAFATRAEAERWLRSLQRCDGCAWWPEVDASSGPLDVRLGDMPSRHNGARWPWRLEIDVLSESRPYLLRIQGKQPYD